VYAIYDEGFEKYGAVVGFSGEFVNHACGEGRGTATRVDEALRAIRDVLLNDQDEKRKEGF